MTPIGCYIGYGISIHYWKLAKILGIEYDINSSSQTEFDWDLYEKIRSYLEKNPIIMSESNMPLSIESYPHDTYLFEYHEIAIGLFAHAWCADVETESALKKILNNGLDKEAFKAKFDLNPRFMVFRDECRCC